MTAVSSVAGSTATTPSTNSLDAIGATQDRFLKLLVAQMQNQDPLNPLDNAQVTSQLASLSTVSGINKLGDLVQSLSNSFNQAQSLQAANMIGRGILTEGSSVMLSGGVATGGFELAGPADQLLVQIKDASGNVIHATDLGPQKAGVSVFQWDGIRDDGTTAPSGLYRFEVQALQNGKPVDATRLTEGTVASVSLSNTDVQLNLLGLGAVSLSQVKQIM